MGLKDRMKGAVEKAKESRSSETPLASSAARVKEPSGNRWRSLPRD
jgi:hypothetical protein